MATSSGRDLEREAANAGLTANVWIGNYASSGSRICSTGRDDETVDVYVDREELLSSALAASSPVVVTIVDSPVTVALPGRRAG